MNATTKTQFLVVDDDPDWIRIISDALTGAGHSVISCGDGESAIGMAHESKPDCVLLDIMMPGKDGLEVCRELKANTLFRDRKIVIVTSKSYEFDRNRAFEFGADGYVLKPTDEANFVGEIERIVSDKIELTFWGVRGTVPVPHPNFMRYGGNTSCVSLAFPDGQLLIFDAGTGINALSNHLLKGGRRQLEASILLSHPHWDHINALPFFAPLYMQGNKFKFYGARHGVTTVRDLVSAQMDDVYFPVTMRQFGAHVEFEDIEEESFHIDDIRVKTMRLNHPGTCLGYRVEYKDRSVCYITDNELYPPEYLQFSAKYLDQLTDFVDGADALITDSTYMDDEYRTKVGWGHSPISQVVDFAHLAGAKVLHLFHHDPSQDDAAVDRKLEFARRRLHNLGSETLCMAPSETQVFRY